MSPSLRAAGALESVAAPKQARSEQTLYRLLDAAESLIEEKGLAAASVPEIVRRAGSSVGGFYARFRDKDELLRALEERFFRELLGRLDALSRPERWGNASIPEIVRPCVAELVDTFREREALIRCFMLRAARQPALLEDALRFRREVSRRIQALLLERRAEIAHPEPPRAIDLGVQFAFGLVQQIAVFGDVHAGGRRLSDAALREEIARNFLAYLGVADAGRDGPHRGRRRASGRRRP